MQAFKFNDTSPSSDTKLYPGNTFEIRFSNPINSEKFNLNVFSYVTIEPPVKGLTFSVQNKSIYVYTQNHQMNKDIDYKVTILSTLEDEYRQTLGNFLFSKFS